MSGGNGAAISASSTSKSNSTNQDGPTGGTQVSLRSLFGFTTAAAAVAGVGAAIPDVLDIRKTEANFTTATSELKLTNSDSGQQSVFLTIKRGAKEELPDASQIEMCVEGARLNNSVALAALRLNGLNNPDADFKSLTILSSLGELFINNCGRLTGDLLKDIPKNIGNITLINAPSFKGAALRFLADSTVSSLSFTDVPVSDENLPDIANLSDLKILHLKGTNCTAKGIADGLGHSGVSMVSFISSEPIKKDCDHVKVLQNWCDQQVGRSAIVSDGSNTEILKSTKSYADELKQTPVVFSGLPKPLP